MKYAVFDEAGFPLGFYAEDIHGARMRPIFGPAPEPTEETPDPAAPIVGEEPNLACLIPADAVAITDEQWSEFVDNQGRRKWIGGEVVAFEPLPPPVDLAAYAADRRWRREVGGMMSPTFGHLYTDRETRAIIGQKIQLIDLGMIVEPVNVKTGAGFQPFSRAALVAIGTEVDAYVQACFDLEMQVLGEIGAGTITSTAEIDVAFS